MAVYTCYEMIDDCRRGRPPGWTHLVTNFVPAFARLLEHYRPGATGNDFWARFLAALRDDPNSPLASVQAVSEREFVFEMRDFLLAFAGVEPAGGEVDWPAFQEALAPLTAVEKQVVWLETMDYDTAAAAALVRVSEETGAQTRRRAAGLLHEHLPGFSIADHAPALRHMASTAEDKPIAVRQLLRALDGQMKWSERQDLDAHLAGSWHDIDRFCRVREADAAVRDTNPLSPEQAAPILASMGVKPAAKPLWKRVFAGQ